MRLSEVRRAMNEFASRFDPSLVSAPDAAHAVDDAAAIEKMAATVKSLAAARVAETEVWRERGDCSAAHDLARRTGTTVGQAKEALETGRKLPDLPATAAAAKKGELSAQQTAAIVDAATADPGAEDRLLEASQSGSLGELRAECARTKANVSDLEDRRRRIHARRCLRSWTDAEGVGNLQLRDNPEKVAEIMARVAPVRDELFKSAGAEGRREPVDAYAADALQQIVCGDTPTTTKSATKILARVDSPRCSGAIPSATRPASSPATGPFPSPRCGTSSIPATRSSGPWSPRGRTSSVLPTSDVARPPTSALRSNGSIQPARLRAATPSRSSSSTTATTGPRPTARSSTSSTGSAPTTTTARPATAGHSSRAGGNAPSSHPTTPDIPTASDARARRHRPTGCRLTVPSGAWIERQFELQEHATVG